MERPSGRDGLSDRCGKGHQFTPENTYIRTGGARVCRQCANERIKDWKARHPDKQQAQRFATKPDLRSRTSSLPSATPNGVSQNQGRVYPRLNFPRGKGGLQGIYFGKSVSASQNTRGGVCDSGPIGLRGRFILESESLFDYSNPGKLFYWTKRGNSKPDATQQPSSFLSPVPMVRQIL